MQLKGKSKRKKNKKRKEKEGGKEEHEEGRKMIGTVVQKRAKGGLEEGRERGELIVTGSMKEKTERGEAWMEGRRGKKAWEDEERHV